MPSHQADRGTKSGLASRRNFLKAAGGASAVGAVGLSGCTGGGDNTVTIGSAFPFTGPYSEEAITQREGLELAVQEMNDNGGLLDRDVEIVERDTELDGEASARRVGDLIDNEDVDLLVANLSGGISLQTQNQAKNGEVPFMAACQTVMDFGEPGFLGAGSFTPYARTAQSMNAAGDFIYDNLGESVYGVIADYAWGNNSWDHMSSRFEERGGSVAGVSRPPLGESDFSSHLTSAQDSDADVLYFHNLGSDTANSIQQVDEFGLQEEMEIFVGVTTTTVARRAGLDMWDGIHAGIYYSPKADNAGTQEFAQKMEDEYGNPGDAYSAVTYTAGKELARAVENAGGLGYEEVSDAIISNPTYQHTKTEEEWRECDNQSIQDWYIVEGKPESEQESEWDVFEPVATRGGLDIAPACEDYENL